MCCLGFISRDILSECMPNISYTQTQAYVDGISSPSLISDTILKKVYKNEYGRVLLKQKQFNRSNESNRSIDRSYTNSELSKAAMTINDGHGSIYSKMTQLTKLFAKHNIRLRFVRHGCGLFYR